MQTKDNSEKRKGSPIKAIVVGLIVDIIGSSIFGILIGIIYSAFLLNKGLAIEEIEKILNSAGGLNTIFGLIGNIGGLLITMLAGYICARIVNYNEYKIVGILGILSSLITYIFALTMNIYTNSELILLSVLVLLCSLSGAFIFIKTKKTNNKNLI